MRRLWRTTWPDELTTAVQAAAEAAGEPREAVLAAVETRHRGWAAGSRSAVYLPEDSDDSGLGLRRVAWQQLERAEWDAQAAVLRLWETLAFGVVMPRTDLSVDDPGRFGQLVRERISASMLVQRHIALAGGTGVRIVGRRSPDHVAAVTWQMVFDDGVDPGEPGLLERAEQALSTVREEFGE